MISLRRLRKDDSEFLFSWANDEAVLKGSFIRSKPVSREDHDRWFHTRVSDPDCYLFIALTDAGERVGQVRFDIIENKPREAMVSIGIAPGHRKKGYATAAIRQGSEEMFKRTNVDILHAYIRPENIGSAKSFEKAEYTMRGLHKYNGVDAIYATKERPK